MGEPEKMWLSAWNGVAGETAHHAPDLGCRKSAEQSAGPHQEKPPISLSTSNFLIHGDQDSTKPPTHPPE